MPTPEYVVRVRALALHRIMIAKQSARFLQMMLKRGHATVEFSAEGFVFHRITVDGDAYVQSIKDMYNAQGNSARPHG